MFTPRESENDTCADDGSLTSAEVSRLLFLVGVPPRGRQGICRQRYPSGDAERRREGTMNAKTFIDEVAHRLQCDAARAEGVVFVVFQELSARLTPDEAADVAAQLPTALKHLWLREDREQRVQRTHKNEFVSRVRSWAGLPSDAEAERALRAVFAELQRLLGSPSGLEGEAWDIFSQLPKDLKRFWLEAAGDAD
jgi:uncharacterized protein (DUF2267 family)